MSILCLQQKMYAIQSKYNNSYIISRPFFDRSKLGQQAQGMLLRLVCITQADYDPDNTENYVYTLAIYCRAIKIVVQPRWFSQKVTTKGGTKVGLQLGTTRMYG